MKKIILYALLIASCISCGDDYDDSKLWDSVNGLENRVAKLEELCKQMNTNISSLQEIVTALQKNESIKSVATLPDGSGYLITFSSGKTITIYHGKNGVDGEDGKDGENGKDAITPVISVKKDADGIYYWTVNNDWLLVDGKKVKAEGTDGKNGTDGKPGANGTDGITPQFKIENGYWYISYDNKLSWTQLGKATGDSGLSGADGDNFFKGVSIEDGYVCFILNDTESTVIKLPFISEKELTIEVKEPGTLKSLLSDENMRTVISLKLKGPLNEDDFATIRYWMFVVENVDLSETTISEVPKDAFREMPRLKKVILPTSCNKIDDGAFAACRILTHIEAPVIQTIGTGAFSNCSNLVNCEFPSLEKISNNAFLNCNSLLSFECSESLTHIGISAFENCVNLTDFTFNEKVTEISTNSFRNCTGLKNITLPIDVTCYSSSTGDRIFVNCTNVTHVIVPEGCTSFSFRVSGTIFSWAPNLISCSFPSTITEIGEYAFYGNNHIESIICYAQNPPRFNTVFEYQVSQLYVPAESIEKYKSSGWKTYFVQILPIEE